MEMNSEQISWTRFWFGSSSPTSRGPPAALLSNHSRIQPPRTIFYTWQCYMLQTKNFYWNNYETDKKPFAFHHSWPSAQSSWHDTFCYNSTNPDPQISTIYFVYPVLLWLTGSSTFKGQPLMCQFLFSDFIFVFVCLILHCDQTFNHDYNYITSNTSSTQFARHH